MDIVKAATFEAVIQSSITACDGQPLCLEEVEVGNEFFIGLGTKCEQRFRWTNENYLTLTDEEHYNPEAGGNESRRLSVPEETQKWVITSKSGCLKQLNDFNPPLEQEYADGHRLAVDPMCDVRHDTEFWAIASPFHVNESLHDLGTLRPPPSGPFCHADLPTVFPLAKFCRSPVCLSRKSRKPHATLGLLCQHDPSIRQHGERQELHLRRL